jgi:hypothetical protein
MTTDTLSAATPASSSRGSDTVTVNSATVDTDATFLDYVMRTQRVAEAYVAVFRPTTSAEMYRVSEAPARAGLEELTSEQEWAQFDAQARRYLGVTGEEFIRDWTSGAYDDRADDPDVARVAMLLPGA